jgi:diguanylate cyclase (GGDEF)-like protein/PAS domain S-box-containing protein
MEEGNLPFATETLRALEPTLELLEDAVLVTTADPEAAIPETRGPRVVFVNGAFARLTGYAPDEIIGKAPPVRYGPVGDGGPFDRIDGELESRRRFYGEATIVGKDGGGFVVQAQIAPLLDDRGRVGHWLVIHRNAVPHVNVQGGTEGGEEVGNDDGEPYRRVIENQPDLICCFLPDTTLTFVNTAYARFFDRAKEALIGRRFIDFVAEEDRPVIRAKLVSATPEAPSTRYEHKTIGADGGVRWHLWNDLAMFDDAGNLLSFQSVGSDITDRKRAEEALFAEKERAEVTLHSIGDAVITTDGEGVIDYLNPVAEALIGLSADKAKGQPIDRVFQIIEEETREPMANPVGRCLKEGRPVGPTAHSVLIGRNGQEFPIEDSVAPIRSRDGRVLGVVLVFRDVTETRRMARQMAHEATHDALTDLVNRREFERRLERAHASAKHYGSRHALCFLDLDQFKLVNETAGHAAGDELLKQVRGLLSGKFRERDTLARLGGDEFGLLLDNCSLQEALKISDIIVGTFRDCTFIWQGRTFQIGVSIGLVPITADAGDAAQLLSQADVACYTAKELGRNRVHVYRREGAEPADTRIQILRAATLRGALEQDRFRLYCQPIVPLLPDSGVPVRFEFLLRLLDTDGDLVWPRAFIPAAERYGLMRAIDRWVIRTAFRHCAERFGDYSGAEIAINLSENSLDDHSLLQFVREQFAEFALPPDRVCFEITETAAFHNLSQTTAFVSGIKESGSRLALDDFGRGMSSFNYLKTLPVDYLKIDGGFVRDMMVSTVDHDLVEAINEVGHIMGIKTIAEYAHSRAIVERLKQLGVDCAQGDAIGLPVPLVDAAPHRPLELH